MVRFHDVSEEDLGSVHVFPKTWIGESGSVVFDSLWPHGLYCPWNSPDQNTGVEYSLSLLQGIFATQELNPGFPQRRQILYQLSHKGSPRILEWVAYPFSRGSSQPRNWTGVSCIAGGFFTNWAFREALQIQRQKVNWWSQGLRSGDGLGKIGKASLIAQLVKNLPAMQETPVQLLDREELLKKG